VTPVRGWRRMSQGGRNAIADFPDPGRALPCNPHSASLRRRPESTGPAGWSMLRVTHRSAAVLMRRSRSQCNYLFL
jgi:hypothetical protein